MKNEFKESMGKILNSPIPENPKHKKVMNDLDSAKKQIFLEVMKRLKHKKNYSNLNHK